jgi:hypothetical protein
MNDTAVAFRAESAFRLIRQKDAGTVMAKALASAWEFVASPDRGGRTAEDVELEVRDALKAWAEASK